MKSKNKKVRVKIEKTKNLSQIEAESLIVKALTSDPHKDEFIDKGNQHAAEVLEKAHKKIFDEIMNGIMNELDNEEL